MVEYIGMLVLHLIEHSIIYDRTSGRSKDHGGDTRDFLSAPSHVLACDWQYPFNSPRATCSSICMKGASVMCIMRMYQT